MSHDQNEVLRASAWVGDEPKVTAEVIWQHSGKRWTARFVLTPQQALNFAEKLRYAGLSLMKNEPRPDPASYEPQKTTTQIR